VVHSACSALLFPSCFFFHRSAVHRDLPSFPTRRSSDLVRVRGGRAPGHARSVARHSTYRGEVGPGVRERPPVRRPACRARPEGRSEEHTSELQSLTNLVCRLLLEKKKKTRTHH